MRAHKPHTKKRDNFNCQPVTIENKNSQSYSTFGNPSHNSNQQNQHQLTRNSDTQNNHLEGDQYPIATGNDGSNRNRDH